jgi:predicted nucleic acid-binding protein
LGILLAAKQRGLIAEVRQMVDALEAAGLHFRPALIATVLAQADEA